MIFDLVKDFADVLDAMPEGHPRRRMLKLLEEAVRRDVHFIDRHPTTFFQCMWNTCWWYDCPDVEYFYDSQEGCSTSKREKLYIYLENWRDRKTETTPSFIWLRSLIPPLFGLGTSIVSTLDGHSSAVNSVAFSGDGRRIATGSTDHTVRICDSVTGQDLSVLRGVESAIVCVALSPNGQVLISGSEDGIVGIWDAVPARQRTSIDAHSSAVTHLCFSVDGSIFASVGRSIRVWDTMSGQKVAEFDGHSGSVGAICPRGSGFEFASASTLHGFGHYISSLLASVSLEQIDTSGPKLVDSIDVHSFSVPSTTGDHKTVVLAKKQQVTAVSLSSDGSHLAVGLGDSLIRVWNVSTGDPVITIHGHRHFVSILAFSPGGSLLAGTNADGTVCIWRVDTGAQFAKLRGHTGTVIAIGFSKDGSQLAIGGTDCVARVWDLRESTRSGGSVRALEFDRAIRLSHGGDIVRGSSENEDSSLDWIEIDANRRVLLAHGCRGQDARRFKVAVEGEAYETTTFDLIKDKPAAWFPGRIHYLTSDREGKCWIGGILGDSVPFRIEVVG